MTDTEILKQFLESATEEEKEELLNFIFSLPKSE